MGLENRRQPFFRYFITIFQPLKTVFLPFLHFHQTTKPIFLVQYS